MNFTELIHTGILATILTTCVTFATCIISSVQGYKKMKIDNFDKIYNSLINFTEKRATILDKCNSLTKEIADALPDEVQEISNKKLKTLYYNTYYGINELITEYSKCLELFLSFSHYLYKNKPIAPIVITECWTILGLYEKLITINVMEEYTIKYAQIVTLVQFIRINGKRKDNKQLNEYLKRNNISVYPFSGMYSG